MIDGILLINKQKNITSYDVIRILKRVLPKGQKIGHGGTLDPFAQGLLIVLLGKATKLMEKIHTLEKEYVVKAEFGYSTDTQDLTGKKVNVSKSKDMVSRQEIEEIVEKNLLGKIYQTPPFYSAKKIDGQRAYTLAREGKEFSLKEKEIYVEKFDVLKYEWPMVEFRIVCSTGTYIRTLINDLGIKSGRYATALFLERVRVGDFKLEDSIKSDDIKQGDDPLLLSKVLSLESLKL